MLVVTRRQGESILIGDNIEIYIVESREGSVKIAVNAPKNVKILRKELITEVQNENAESLKNIEHILQKFNITKDK
jgi:carbon storage regulator